MIINENPEVCDPLLNYYNNFHFSLETRDPFSSSYAAFSKIKIGAIDEDGNLIFPKDIPKPLDIGGLIPVPPLNEYDFFVKKLEFEGKELLIVNVMTDTGWRWNTDSWIWIVENSDLEKVIPNRLTTYKDKAKFINYLRYISGEPFGKFDTNLNGSYQQKYNEYKNEHVIIDGFLRSDGIYILVADFSFEPPEMFWNGFANLSNLQNGKKYSLYKYNGSSEFQKVCQLQGSRPLTEAELPKDLLSIRDAVKSVIGEGGSCEGTSLSFTQMRKYVDVRIWKIAARPWLLQNGLATTSNDKDNLVIMKKALSKWSRGDIWSYKKIEHFYDAINNFSKTLIEDEFLKKKNDLDFTNNLSSEVVDNAIYSFFFGFLKEGYYGYSMGDKYIDEIISGSFNADVKFYKKTPKGEPRLSFALLNYNILENLLENKIYPDTKNKFGKTTLMYAAQLNNSKAVELLLQYGANPYLETDEISDCYNYRINYSINNTRNALKYAEENKSVDSVKILKDWMERYPEEYYMLKDGTFLDDINYFFGQSNK
ncbi:ankyrin repeat domain-containing protein [Alphaproteobacteria bacterium]|nr:ankyrin repeat domain-containing protein [Alphaproteobacteria bacterium]